MLFSDYQIVRITGFQIGNSNFKIELFLQEIYGRILYYKRRQKPSDVRLRTGLEVNGNQVIFNHLEEQVH
jgi:hypothetical protein